MGVGKDGVSLQHYVVKFNAIMGPIIYISKHWEVFLKR